MPVPRLADWQMPTYQYDRDTQEAQVRPHLEESWRRNDSRRLLLQRSVSFLFVKPMSCCQWRPAAPSVAVKGPKCHQWRNFLKGAKIQCASDTPYQRIGGKSKSGQGNLYSFIMNHLLQRTVVKEPERKSRRNRQRENGAKKVEVH